MSDTTFRPGDESRSTPAPTRPVAGRAAHPRMVLAICCSSLFIAQFDATAVNVALPSIGRDLHAGISGLQWVADAYVLVLAGLVMSSGAAGDRMGRLRVFRLGLICFTAFSIGCSLAPSLGWLVAARALQAVGASMLMPTTLSILSNAFSDERRRAQAIGVWAGVAGISAAAGPILGGALVDASGWPAIFWINVPVTTAALLLASRFISESRSAHPPSVDVPGQLLVIAFVAFLTFGLIEAPHAGWGSRQTLVLLGLALLVLGGFVRVELGREEPLLDVRLFRTATFAGANLVAVLAYLALLGVLFLNTLYLQQVRGLTPFEAGLVILPCPVGLLVVAPISGRLTGRVGPRLPIVLGGLCLAAASLLLLALTPSVGLGLLVVAYLVLGVGWGMVNPPITNAAVNAMPRDQAGVASAVTGTARQIGGVTGVALLGSLTATRFADLAGGRAPSLPAAARVGAVTAVHGAGVRTAGDARNVEALHRAFTTATHVGFGAAAAAGLLVAVIGGRMMRPAR